MGPTRGQLHPVKASASTKQRQPRACPDRPATVLRGNDLGSLPAAGRRGPPRFCSRARAAARSRGFDPAETLASGRRHEQPSFAGLRLGASNDVAVHRHTLRGATARTRRRDCRFASASGRLTDADSDAAGCRPRGLSRSGDSTCPQPWRCRSQLTPGASQGRLAQCLRERAGSRDEPRDRWMCALTKNR
jgi:hypothetical protein